VSSSRAGAAESVASGLIDHANRLPLPASGDLPAGVPVIMGDSR
jgi:hypothetical protein